MSFVRLFIAWLLMAALPLQGFAAASMVLCAPAPASAAAMDMHGEHGQGGHDEASHHGDHDPGHGSAHDADVSHASHGTASAADHASGTAHACGLCAACSHLLALPTEGVAPQVGPSPPADLPQPALRIVTRAQPRPDKPPRA